MITALAGIGLPASTTISLVGDDVPDFSRPSARAAALHLPDPKPLGTPGFMACAMALKNAFPPACFKHTSDSDRYIKKIRGDAPDGVDVTLTGSGGVALTNGSGYKYATTCQYYDCNGSTGHVLGWYYPNASNCTHTYIQNDSYVDYVDHGFLKITNHGFGPQNKNCNAVGMYKQTGQGGAGAFMCRNTVCEAYSSESYDRLWSFSLHYSGGSA